MRRFEIVMAEETSVFYEKIAKKAGRSVEQVLADSLFVLAGELASEMIYHRKKRESFTPAPGTAAPQKQRK